MKEMIMPKVGDVILVDGDRLQEAIVLAILDGRNEMSLDKDATFFKVKMSGAFGKTRWINSYYLKGIVSNSSYD